MTSNHLKISAARALLAVMLLTGTLARGATYHVSPFGSNTPPYSSLATAAHDPRHANALATGYGDTVLLHSGEYLIPTTIVVDTGVTWIGDGADSVILHWTGPKQPIIWTWIVGGAGDNLFSGICFLNPNPQGQDNLLGLGKGNNGALSLTVLHCRFNACGLEMGILRSAEIHDNQFDIWVGDGMWIVGAGDFNIHNNLFLGGTYAPGRAIILDNGARAVIEGNRFDFRASVGNGLQASPVTVTRYAKLARIDNNLIWGGDCAIYVEEASATIENNTIVRAASRRGGIEAIFAFGDTMVIRNNIFADLTTIPFLHAAVPYQPPIVCSACLAFEHNAYWPPEDSIYNPYPGQIDPADTGNFSAYPMFVDDSLFHLQYGSPLIDAGDPSILDADGSRSDIGWTGGPGGASYEYLDLPPKPPDSLKLAGQGLVTFLAWSRRCERDLKEYRLYRGDFSRFWHAGLTPVSILPLSDTDAYDAIQGRGRNVFYVVTAVDSTGHESQPSPEAPYIFSGVPGDEGDEPLPRTPTIARVYPNPFNAATTTEVFIPDVGAMPAPVRITLYDVMGRLVSVPFEGLLAAGNHPISISATDTQGRPLASGMCFARLRVWSMEFGGAKKLVVLK